MGRADTGGARLIGTMAEYKHITGIVLPSHAGSGVPLRLGHLLKLIQATVPSVTHVTAHGHGATSPDRVVVTASGTLDPDEQADVLAAFATMEADATLGLPQPSTGRVKTLTFTFGSPHFINIHGQKWRAPQDILITRVTMTAGVAIEYDVPATHMIADVMTGTYTWNLAGMAVAGTLDLPSEVLEVSTTPGDPVLVSAGEHIVPYFTSVAAAEIMPTYTVSVDYMEV